MTPSAEPGAGTKPDVSWERVATVGLLAGFTSGLFGVGGGIVIVPALVLLVGFPQKLAVGTSLTAIVPISIAGILGYASDGEVDWAVAACVAVGALAGAVFGTRLLVRLSAPVLQVMFAVAMAATAVRMLVESGDGAGRGDLTAGMVVGLVLVGLASGLLAGLLGVGGGVIIVPVLTLAFGVPHVLAKGTSLAVILPTAVMGTLRNRRSQLTALRPAAIVGVAGVLSAFAASQVSLALDPALSRALFAVLLVVVAIRLARTGWAGRRDQDPAPR
jgi:uncharacterized membrane protein YfcA